MANRQSAVDNDIVVDPRDNIIVSVDRQAEEDFPSEDEVEIPNDDEDEIYDDDGREILEAGSSLDTVVDVDPAELNRQFRSTVRNDPIFQQLVDKAVEEKMKIEQRN